MDNHLFLFGSGPPFTSKMASLFMKQSNVFAGSISVLFIERKGWRAYMPTYTNLLEKAGARNFNYLPLPSTPVETVINTVKESSGILIGGGNTNLYADYIVDSPISDVIKHRYELGAPVAGFSAGALISPKFCIISPKDNVKGIYQQRAGLGLLSKLVIAVHFSQWQDEEHLKQAVQAHIDSDNYGIDERAGIYLLNGKLEATEGCGIYQIQNGDVVKIQANDRISFTHTKTRLRQKNEKQLKMNDD
ncbi:MAG: Type 1 glutamine amidotransferase-like domain-containing protein [Bacillota bacterium]|uniref:Type 1 glutamine amidotransferase-like domain-containing protein n=1 Tax=Virgibacillus salarius TaxID=447199 RepID=A0A941IBA1_9BACI|nr:MULTISPECIES: Type 1 glutamine amidotransferase-like domain-containing protein [Virgibacillus]NAZ08924.1 type 1 glutamine amidotransferase-like domain-containing protein [Agaribacter marinus]MBR7796216.1 Type 1 glutamine amidotransferase-like domain-containing protein [Virgibacillus salarius]MCC2252387.1 Type 1 glutamine amidotransferase-like domain-containing protein [Virgibacillus sp. AGTR]MDY7045124.1 Type 1 glutamine amidotransferase-like domain-containing protein [Virgibacillus sp. M23]